VREVERGRRSAGIPRYECGGRKNESWKCEGEGEGEMARCFVFAGAANAAAPRGVVDVVGGE